jgi:release factor glutamine methyltransferase
MFALMTNKQIYRQFLHQLEQIYSSLEAMTITDWTFETVAGVKRSDLIKNPDQVVENKIILQLNSCLIELMQHKPIQYILGEAWFFKMKFKVNDQVLIPRPETEELVQLVLDNYNNKKYSQESGEILSILDIGTGSGCIATALKNNLTNSVVHATDVSEGALEIAKENALNLKAEINFISLDFLNENSWHQLPNIDIIISNPPYIPFEEKKILDKNVTQYEPHQALFVTDSSPFIFYEKIAAFGKKHLLANGKIFVEFHEEFAIQTAAIFEVDYLVEIKKDIFGKDRMLIINKK